MNLKCLIKHDYGNPVKTVYQVRNGRRKVEVKHTCLRCGKKKKVEYYRTAT